MLKFPKLYLLAVIALVAVALACLVGMDVSIAAPAAGAKTDINTVDALPWYQALEPYLQALWEVVVSAALAFGAAVFYRWTGIRLADSDRQAIQTAASNAAGRIIAGVEGPVSNIKFDLGKGPYASVIAAEVEHIRSTLPDELERRKITPEHIAGLVHAKLGQLQSGTLAIPHS